jgi:hypothetical protein
MRTNGIEFDATSQQIKNVADPTDAQDAATKNYVDTGDSSTLASAVALNASNAASASASASSASNSAAAAYNSELAAAASEAAAATTYDNFDDRYLGAKASDPTLDNDGDALIDGALYFDTTLNVMKFYDLGNTAWKQTTPTSADQTNIDAAVANASNINSVAAIDTDVTTVAGISSDVTTVAADGTDIGTVAGISANVTTVAGISSDVTTVAGISGDVSSVAAQVIGYDFSTTTAMADPGSGNVRFNNATVASVTAIAIDDLDKNGVDQSAYIALFDDSTNTVKGTLVFRTGGGDVATFNITGLTDNTGWFQIAVTHVASSGTFADGEDTFIGFTRSGDKGADGAGSGDVSGPGSATDNAVVRWDGTSGQLVQNSGVTINDSGDLTANNLSGTNTGDEVAASESTAGVVELATTAEAEAGTDTVRAVTPAGAAAAIAALAVSPANPNLIINGNMALAQRGTSFASPSSGSYTLDRFYWNFSGSGAVTITQDTDVPTIAEAGIDFKTSMKIDVTTADASLGATDTYSIIQPIEGFNTAHLGFGASDAATVTLSFWVKSPKTGTHHVVFYNAAVNRSYPASYTVTSANTWEKKTITLSGDVTGTWVGATNGIGLNISFGLGVGSNYEGTADAWQAGILTSASGAANCMDNTANNFYLTGVKLEVGSTATDFVPDDYSTALAKCQRYYQIAQRSSAAGLWQSASTANLHWYFTVPMRANPTMTILNTSLQIVECGVATKSTGTAAFNAADASEYGVNMQIGGYSSATTYNPAYLYTDDSIQAAAEL